MEVSVAPVGSSDAQTASTRPTSWSTAHGNPKMASTARGTLRSIRPTIAAGSPATTPWMTAKNMNATMASAASWATWWYAPFPDTNAATVTCGLDDALRNADTSP